MVQEVAAKPSRTFIACDRCKTRKKRCDGQSPKCLNCEIHNAECHYVAVRKTRGLGKRQKDTKDQEEPSDAPRASYQLSDHEDTNIQKTSSTIHISSKPSTQRDTSVSRTLTVMDVRDRLPIMPDFLLPGTFDRHLEAIQTDIQAAAATRGFTSLMPAHISRRLINNCFPDIMAEHPFITLPSFFGLLDAQYAVSATDPTDDPARWAVVNATVALAIRFKTAAGSEDYISPIAQSFYLNATRVVHQLILLTPSMLSIQALLAMAVFARGIPSTPAFIMLVTNASCQLEMLDREESHLKSMLSFDECVQFQQMHQVVKKLSEEVKLML
ncbi:hypothetical protein HD806DRAFT_515919 [Xylariaceae sp. AK1471]|nr:hypothetical protein HD806DRAFT_515919 [Xylariaceae sp. AK1471]